MLYVCRLFALCFAGVARYYFLNVWREIGNATVAAYQRISHLVDREWSRTKLLRYASCPGIHNKKV